MSSAPPPTGVSSSNPTGPTERPDAAAFFRTFYEANRKRLKNSYESDIAAFEREYGTGSGYTRVELQTIAETVRAEIRSLGVSGPNEGNTPPTGDSRAWVQWLRDIEFGKYILASLGLVFFLAVLIRFGDKPAEIAAQARPIVALGIVLALLGVGFWRFRDLALPDRIKPIASIIFSCAFLLAVLVAVFWFIHPTLQDYGILKKPTPPPTVIQGIFPVDYFQTHEDPGLPEEVFGKLSDEGQPLYWMHLVELGACSELKVQADHATLTWILTPEFKCGLANPTVYIQTGTGKNTVVLPYLVYTDQPTRLAPLKRAQGQGPKSVVPYTVPPTQSPVRLLALVAMETATYETIKDASKFEVRSSP